MTDDTRSTADLLFAILSSSRRRYALYYCSRKQRCIELTDLAEEIAAWENDTTVEELSSQARKRVYVSLYQTHVPKLDEADLVEYDSETGEVRLTADESDLDPYLAEQAAGPSWQRYYLGVSALHAVLVFGSVGSFSPLDVGPLPLAAFVIGSLFLLIAAHVRSNRQSGSIPFEGL